MSPELGFRGHKRVLFRRFVEAEGCLEFGVTLPIDKLERGASLETAGDDDRPGGSGVSQEIRGALRLDVQ